MSYWREAGRWARTNTKTYSIGKALPAALAAAAQWRFFRLRPLYESLITIGALFGSYFLLWVLEFLHKLLFVAPAAFHGSQQATIINREAEITRLTGRTRGNPLQSRPSATTMIPSGMNLDQAYAMLGLLAVDGVLSYTRNPLPDGHEEVFEIAQGMTSVVDDLIYPPRSSD